MSNAGPKYFEGVENIWLNNGMVHMHLVAMTRAAEKEEPAPRTIQELVIPLPNFVNFCEAMGNVLLEMEKQGVIKRKDTEEEPKS